MWFPDFPGCQQNCSLPSRVQQCFIKKMLVWQKKKGYYRLSLELCIFFSACEALLLPPLRCLYQHNKMLYSMLLYCTEGPISVTEITSQIYGVFSFVSKKKKKKKSGSCVVSLSVSLLSLCAWHRGGVGDWHIKEETDNSSEALKLYWCIDDGVSCQLYSS